MARTVTFVAGALAVAAASALYALKYDTARLESDVHKLERAIEKTENDIAVLRAERAYLGRPERIDALASRQGLAPVTPTQYRWSSEADLMDTTNPDQGNGVAGLKSLTDAEALAAAKAILAPQTETPTGGRE
ncbi:MAG: cell division protein FtsL [Hyphomicrobiaceae bacterium]